MKSSKFRLEGGRAGRILVREGARRGHLDWEMLVGDLDMVIYADSCLWSAPVREPISRADVLRLAQEYAVATRIRLEVAFADGSVALPSRDQ